MKQAAVKWAAWITAAALFSMLFLVEPSAAGANKTEQTLVTMTVRTSKKADFASELTFTSNELSKALGKAKTEPAPSPDLLRDIELTVAKVSAGKETEGGASSEGGTYYRLETNGNLWSAVGGGERTVMPEHAAALLLRCAGALRNQHYGKLIAWDEAERILPRKSMFSVTDIESGLTFRVQRRAGSDHADVQPLTKEDTKIMKEIYGDKWSWNRKAVLVHAGEEWIAASMNGMPHGGDGIPDNDFSGHSCIHFYKSSTHKSDRPDLAHQLMVHKAAGDLDAYFDGLSPSSLAKTFIAVMNHKEAELLWHLGDGLAEDRLSDIEAEMESLSSIREEVSAKSKNKGRPADKEYGERLTAEVVLAVSFEKKGQSRQSGKYRFSFQRQTAKSSWRFSDVTSD